MLVLTRRKDQSIMIGHDIEIVVIAIEGDQIKLGIKAPRHIDIHRKEIYTAIQESNKEAQTQHSKSIDIKKLLKELSNTLIKKDKN